ncbi:uncharacterized protein LAJ45_09960 [Morchella importuna]|nr:uncharacterized protein LAJ45_09960 [Morchella importuna]KAH8146038.1 hypothetical protein LAJ45_09960 [Morchella importuna]
MPTAVDMNANTRLHVDELILDYLCWFCIESVLSERKLRQEGKVGKREWADASKSAEMGLKLVNSFYQTFTRAHPNNTLPDSINLRLRLCRFTTLFLRRLDVTSPTFSSNATQGAARAQAWLSRRRIPHVFAGIDSTAEAAFDVPKTPFSEEKSHKNQEEMLRQMGYYTLPAPDRSMWGHAALKDVLKEFMILSTWNSANFAEVSRLWVENAANFMLQAVLEAYRCHGASELDAVNECFSWGRTEIDATTEDIEEVVINEMFSGDSGEISAEFEGVKKEILVGILPPTGSSLEAHFDKLAEQNPWSKFEEATVGGYLTAVLSKQPKPVLNQLENGKLAGFNNVDIEEILANAGVSL